jgi:enoyl-CoA hydratase/carnithine racemase
MADRTVAYEVSGGVGTITLNRPHVLNAIDFDLIQQLADAAEDAANDDRVWVVVLRGAGRAFCSGIDRTALARGEIGADFYRAIARATNWLEDMPKLSIAVMHSWSIGGGLQLASACDLRLAADDAVLEFGATRHGLVPDATILRIARIIGMGRAKQLALLNERVAPATALDWGLVNWIAPADQLQARLDEILDSSFYASRTAVAESKRLLQQSFHRDPRSMVEELVAAEMNCHDSWELQVANQAWSQRESEVRYFPRAAPRH